VIQSFIDWIDSSGFYTKTVWDIEQGQWIGAGLMQLFPHQRRILEHVFTQREDGTFPYTTIVYSAVKKSGKAVWVETPIATPTGWKTMGDLQEGDQVFDECGKPCRVIFATDVMYDHPCYRVEFSNGEVIIADAEHQWYVGGRMKAGKSLRDRQCLYWHLTTTEVMAKTVIAPWDKNLRMYSLPVTHPLELPDAPLPVPPYTLGAWLGDGSSDCAMLTVGHGDEEILAIISTEGVPVHAAKHTDRTPRYSLTNRSLQRCSVGTALRDEGLLHNKHIPPIYFRASLAQRLELLRGLMDTDGYISKDGRCEFTSTSKRLARDLQELLATLGIKAKVTESEAKLNGVVISPKYRVHFQSYQDLPVFHLTRKCERLVPRKKAVTRSELVRVVSITPIESVPVRCIQVDSPSHLYLVGRTLIPTHNTQISAAIGSWAGECFPENSEIFAMANDKEQAQGISFADIDYHAARKLGIAATRDRLNYPNGTFIQVIANQYASAAGSRHAMCLWDELWGYRTEKDRRMWAEMTPPPSIPHAMRVITTYAGFENESDLLLSLYNACFKKEGGKFVHGEVVPELADIVDAKGEAVCRRNGRTFVYWDTEPRMPWQTPEYYEEQASDPSMRASDFLRYHRNQWVTSNESFIPIELWERAEKKLQGPITIVKGTDQSALPISVGIDIGVKHDCSALVGVYYDVKRRKAGIAFHRIWTPPKRNDKEAEILDLEYTVELELLTLWKQYRIVSVVYDPMQFQRSAMTLARKGMPLVEFQQQGSHMIAASQNLYDLLKTGNLEAYYDPELRDHIRYAAAETTARGFRLVKGKGKYAIDAAVALAMAAFDAVNRGGGDTTTPFEMIMPFSDASAVHIPNANDVYTRALPEALRD
jgi:hypothetical protein